ncbi:MAG TPA: 16S rRNA (adenine(1518)-N(6)/adenine(1519)-N(6))-dimethyltransferase RsmA [Smithellaceae bacterium]|nr:16S rRNA (adenine(1518)-N(6)/adenine(1519)-N(6))-dimethyltransferase RsmA [Smithellaceae bacterium]
MQTPKDLLRTYQIRPRKRLSQSFLIDANTVRKIVSAGAVGSTDTVLEIGAGNGVMTRLLAAQAGQLIAVEIDEQLLPVLEDQLLTYPAARIENADILKLNISDISSRYGMKIKVMGNVPYHISTPLIFHLLAHRSAIDSFTLMLQEEVVDRLVSGPDCKPYGVPSVLLQMFAEVEKLFSVSAGCFSPRPKVQSAVMRGRFRKSPVVELADEAFFSAIVKAAFAQRRKMLMNNLTQAVVLKTLSTARLRSCLDQAGIDGKRRGETLTLEEFGNLSNLLKKEIQCLD